LGKGQASYQKDTRSKQENNSFHILAPFLLFNTALIHAFGCGFGVGQVSVEFYGSGFVT
jgi:hypothetical protein